MAKKRRRGTKPKTTKPATPVVEAAGEETLRQKLGRRIGGEAGAANAGAFNLSFRDAAVAETDANLKQVLQLIREDATRAAMGEKAAQKILAKRIKLFAEFIYERPSGGVPIGRKSLKDLREIAVLTAKTSRNPIEPGLQVARGLRESIGPINTGVGARLAKMAGKIKPAAIGGTPAAPSFLLRAMSGAMRRPGLLGAGLAIGASVLGENIGGRLRRRGELRNATATPGAAPDVHPLMVAGQIAKDDPLFAEMLVKDPDLAMDIVASMMPQSPAAGKQGLFQLPAELFAGGR